LPERLINQTAMAFNQIKHSASLLDRFTLLNPH
jgi:hypothetical protein